MIEEKKSGAQRVQPATRDEFWSDERVRTFLAMQPPEGISADFHILLKAYRGMVPHTFKRFVAFFVAEGHDINAPDPEGLSLLDHVLEHRKSAEYATILQEAGARSTR